MRKTAGIIAVAAAIAGCREKTPPPEVTYRLVASDDRALPTMLQADSCYHVLKAGNVRITGSSFASSYGIDIACHGKGIRQLMAGARGTFAAQGDSLVFRDSAGAVMGRGTLRSDTLAIQGALHRLIYVRQQ